MDAERVARLETIMDALDRTPSGRVVVVPEGVKFDHGTEITWPPGRGPDRDAKRKRVVSVLDREKGRCQVYIIPGGARDDGGDKYPWPPAVDADLFSMAAHKPAEAVLAIGERKRQYSAPVLEHILSLLEHVQRRLTVSAVCEQLSQARIGYQDVLVDDTLVLAHERGELTYARDVWGNGYGLPEWGGDEEE